MPLTTEQAARKLRVSYWCLVHAMNTGCINPLPEKFGFSYTWTEDDVQRAREALRSRRGLGRPKKAIR